MTLTNASKIDRAVTEIDATAVGPRYVYNAGETNRYYVVSAADLADLGARLIERDACAVVDWDDAHHDAYSHWCANTLPLGEGKTAESAIRDAGLVDVDPDAPALTDARIVEIVRSWLTTGASPESLAAALAAV